MIDVTNPERIGTTVSVPIKIDHGHRQILQVNTLFYSRNSEFLCCRISLDSRLNSTPDTRTGVNYLVLGSKDDTTATPYESTFLKASPGSAVINVEEHSLPGVKPTDVIGHVDTPKPVVDTIVRFLTAADTHPEIDTKIDRSLGVTITDDSGITTVRSGDNTILYQGPSSDSASVKAGDRPSHRHHRPNRQHRRTSKRSKHKPVK